MVFKGTFNLFMHHMKLSHFQKEITDLLDDEDDEEEEELNAIEKHMNRTVNKKKLHKNTVTFEDEIERKKEKRSKEDDEFETKAAFDEEMDVYRSDEENDEGWFLRTCIKYPSAKIFG